MSLFTGLKRMLGQKEQGEAYIETRLDRYSAAGPLPPPPPPPPSSGPTTTSDPLGSGMPPLAPPAPAGTPPAQGFQASPPAPVPAVEEELAPIERPLPRPRPKARVSGAAVKLLMADGSSSELDDPELAARAEYLVKNLLSPKPPGPKS
jgi:hypothetical protein